MSQLTHITVVVVRRCVIQTNPNRSLWMRSPVMREPRSERSTELTISSRAQMKYCSERRWLGQVPVEQPRVDAAALARPGLRGGADDVDDGQVEPALQPGELRRPVIWSSCRLPRNSQHGPLVPLVGQRRQHAEERGDARRRPPMKTYPMPGLRSRVNEPCGPSTKTVSPTLSRRIEFVKPPTCLIVNSTRDRSALEEIENGW